MIGIKLIQQMSHLYGVENFIYKIQITCKQIRLVCGADGECVGLGKRGNVVCRFVRHFHILILAAECADQYSPVYGVNFPVVDGLFYSCSIGPVGVKFPELGRIGKVICNEPGEATGIPVRKVSDLGKHRQPVLVRR